MTQSGILPSYVYELTAIPMPPSDNNLFLNIPRRGRVKGPEYRQYCADFEAWRLSNLTFINTLKKAFKAAQGLSLDLTFKFPRGSLYCKDGSVKRLDVQNRFKAICDCLAGALDKDDRYFFRVSAQKIVGEKPEAIARIKILDIPPKIP